jgi:hypothetical protein
MPWSAREHVRGEDSVEGVSVGTATRRQRTLDPRKLLRGVHIEWGAVDALAVPDVVPATKVSMSITM